MFVNAPYSPIQPWLDKAILEPQRGARIYMLVLALAVGTIALDLQHKQLAS